MLWRYLGLTTPGYKLGCLQRQAKLSAPVVHQCVALGVSPMNDVELKCYMFPKEMTQTTSANAKATVHLGQHLGGIFF